jgi:RNA polymerase sigma factor (TIGR02999 family)
LGSYRQGGEVLADSTIVYSPQLKSKIAPRLAVTQLLQQLSGGNHGAVDELTPLVYKELKRIAAGQLHKKRSGHMLQATALVHEAYLKLVDQREASRQNRAHFFGVAWQVMR